MTRLPALARVGLGGGRWLLPWIAVLLASTTLAYAMNSALAGPSASDQPPAVQVAVSTGEATRAAAIERSTMSPSAVSEDPGRSLVPEPCAASGSGPMYVGVDWWIVAESHKIACAPARP